MTQASTYTWFNDDIPIQSYVPDVKSIIHSSMQKHTWEVESETEEFIIAKLTHRSNEIRLKILFNDSRIAFEPLTSFTTSCNQAPPRKPNRTCAVDGGDLARWRIHLRKSILALIQDLARTDAMEKYYALSGKMSPIPAVGTGDEDEANQEDLE